MVMKWDQLFKRDRWWVGRGRDRGVRDDRILFNIEFRRRFGSGISIEFGFFHKRISAEDMISFRSIDFEFKDLIVFLIAEKDPFIRGRRFQNVLVVKPGEINFHAREIPSESSTRQSSCSSSITKEGTGSALRSFSFLF